MVGRGISARRILHRQGYHLLGYVILGALLWLAVRRFSDDVGFFVGVSTVQWLLLSWFVAGLFQGWVALFWRLELYGSHVSAVFGRRSFTVHRVGFVLLGSLRLLAVIPISLSSTHTIQFPFFAHLLLIVATTPFILWGLWSVLFHFGVNRAFGQDHFAAEYRSRTLEQRGIFRYVRNSMYTVVLLALYHPGLLLESRLGLVAAAAHHALVWVHYYCTELPDMREIYGKSEGDARGQA